jgi:hypothetical protein
MDPWAQELRSSMIGSWDWNPAMEELRSWSPCDPRPARPATRSSEAVNHWTRVRPGSPWRFFGDVRWFQQWFPASCDLCAATQTKTRSPWPRTRPVRPERKTRFLKAFSGDFSGGINGFSMKILGVISYSLWCFIFRGWFAYYGIRVWLIWGFSNDCVYIGWLGVCGTLFSVLGWFSGCMSALADLSSCVS